MEQRRLLIAVALSFLVFFLWQTLFVDTDSLKKNEPSVQTENQVKKVMPLIDDKELTMPATVPSEAVPQPSIPLIERSKTVTVKTPLYEVEISESGALLKSFVLKKYREAVESDSDLKELIAEDNPFGSVGLTFSGSSLQALDRVVYKTQNDLESLEITNASQPVSFYWNSPQGITVEKRFIFNPDTYRVELAIIIQNGSSQSLQGNIALSLNGRVDDKSSRYGFVGPSGMINNKIDRVKLKKLKDKNVFPGEISWIAMQDRYFMSSIIADQPVEGEMKLLIREDNWLQNELIHPGVVIGPGSQEQFNYQLFFGPKSMDVLKPIGHGIDKVINFGMFDILAKPCLWLMNKLYGIIPNYGIAIIILTVFTKIILWPLGSKSYKSMNDMKKLQPLMTGIREKYKDDKKRMNEEMMGLYKIYKINPMGGCLPMIVQIPVFFALYRMLYEAIELRHAPFLGWINDLSAPDRLFHFGFSIPFMEPPYGIPVLTIIMGGTMFLQQKMTPTPGDPTQAKMMMLMPLFFTFIFINFSSGLVLYWLVNNILSISQQHYISRKYA